jgi:hypothetical protein
VTPAGVTPPTSPPPFAPPGSETEHDDRPVRLN